MDQKTFDRQILNNLKNVGEEMRKSRFGGVTTAEFDILNAKLDTLLDEVRSLQPTRSILIIGEDAVAEYKRLKEGKV